MVCYVIHDFILSIDDADAGPGPSSPPKRPKKRNIQHSEEVPYTASIVVNVNVPKESKEEVKKIQSNYQDEKITKEGKNRKVCVLPQCCKNPLKSQFFFYCNIYV